MTVTARTAGRVALDKSEGPVKKKPSLSVPGHLDDLKSAESSTALNSALPGGPIEREKAHGHVVVR